MNPGWRRKGRDFDEARCRYERGPGRRQETNEKTVLRRKDVGNGKGPKWAEMEKSGKDARLNHLGKRGFGNRDGATARFSRKKKRDGQCRRPLSGKKNKRNRHRNSTGSCPKKQGASAAEQAIVVTQELSSGAR